MHKFVCSKIGKYVHSLSRNQLTLFRKCSTTSNVELKQTFEQYIGNRRLEADRSIVVQVSSERSFPELYNYCTAIGKIKDAHHYQTLNDDASHFILIEFENENCVQEVIKSSNFIDDLHSIPVKSTFLWFKADGKKSAISSKPCNHEHHLATINGEQKLTDKELDEVLKCSKSVEDQIEVLYNSIRLNDIGIRLRFVAAKQIETSISGMFPNAKAVPFGSTVNGFGKTGCDLDLILRFDNDYQKVINNSRLIFHTKECSSNGRSQTQRQMECIADILQLFSPGVSQVRKILQARVPIIKYHHEYLNLEVDLSMSNLTGAYMSELLYLFGQIDKRVQPLIFCLRKWAQVVGLTNPSPGRWISNFSLTCLVIFFLQQLKEPILPSVNFLFKSALSDDIRITEDGINCTFLRNFNNLKFQTNNTKNMSELLLQFFEYYSQFDFSNRAISLNEGCSVSKPDHSAMYIVNPLESILNVSKNVSLEECERFCVEVRNAAWIMESESENLVSECKHLNKSWGLLNLFKNTERKVMKPSLFYRSRMFEIQELFDEKETPIDFKNEQVAKQIQNITSKTKRILKNIKKEVTDSNLDENSIRIVNKQKSRRR